MKKESSKSAFLTALLGLYSLNERSHQSRETIVKLCQLERQSHKSSNCAEFGRRTDFAACFFCEGLSDNSVEGQDYSPDNRFNAIDGIMRAFSAGSVAVL